MFRFNSRDCGILGKGGSRMQKYFKREVDLPWWLGWIVEYAVEVLTNISGFNISIVIITAIARFCGISISCSHHANSWFVMCAGNRHIGRQAAIDGDTDEVVHWTVHSSAEVTVLPITWSYRSSVQCDVCCVLQLVADHERLASVLQQTLAQTPTIQSCSV